MAVPDKSAKTTSDAILDHILARFGAPGEVITDQRSEFEGTFHTLLNQHHITHRTAGREHPQSDGLAERLVQTLKSALRKNLLSRHRQDWDLYLPYIAMGYRMTKQASTACTPYYLTYGRHPLFQANNQDAEHDFLPLDKNLPKFLEERGKLYQGVMPLAMRNLAIAQQRDIHHYFKVHDRYDRPKATYYPGEFVYVKRKTKGDLDIATHPQILQITKI